MTLYGIWCKDRLGEGDWLRHTTHREGIVAFTSERAAKKAAASEYGRMSYAEVKRDDWCEVRPIGEK